ncbi:hypothetical protein DVH05_001035 [Phytophthora capsici]|nr:hypothetical protein DVH05_001035 [Phytophthora capsici]
MKTPDSSEESDKDMAPTQVAAEAAAADEEEKADTVDKGIMTEEMSETKGSEPEKALEKRGKMKPFKPRTRVGRPRKDRAADAAQRRQSRKEYNQGSKLRGALRGDDVVEVAEFIKSCEPPLSDLSSFLTTFKVRHLRSNPKQLSVVWRVPEPSVIPYRLPETMVCEGLRLIEFKRPFGEAIDLCTPLDTTAECWVLTVDSIGDFTHQQLLYELYLESCACE